MSFSYSENLIFEITKELSDTNVILDKEALNNILSNIIVKYKIEKLSFNENCHDLHEKIDLFLSAKKLENFSRNSIDGYKLELKTFSNHIHKRTFDITTSDIRVFLSKFNHLKTSSLAKKISVLKSFFGWLLQEEIIQKDPTSKIKTPRYNKRNPKYLEVDELEMLREACQTSRQRALVEVMYATGCRLQEVHDMDITDIDLHKFSAKVVGKGDKQREVFFSMKAMYHLKKYLDSRKDDCEALFVTERKPYRRVSDRAIQREIKKIGINSNIKKNITPHVLRHTFASLSLNNNMDISVIQSILGHSSVATTQVYAHITDENKRQQYKKHLVM